MDERGGGGGGCFQEMGTVTNGRSIKMTVSEAIHPPPPLLFFLSFLSYFFPLFV